MMLHLRRGKLRTFNTEMANEEYHIKSIAPQKNSLLSSLPPECMSSTPVLTAIKA